MSDADAAGTGEASTIRIGILGAARIAPKAVIGPASELAGVAVTRVAARDRDRAEAFAAEHGIAAVGTTYRDVVEADDVDVVYNPLPMSLHAEWSIAALLAGKDVLCEKPFASNKAEAEEMVRVAEEEGRVLTEAFHYRYHPLFRRILDELDGGTIGEVERIDARFETPVAKPNLRWDYATSGGSLMDLGCYPVSWVRQVTGEEPEVVRAEAVEGPPRIDARMTAELAFPSGVTATMRCAMDRGPAISLTVVGAKGRIVAANPLTPQNGNRLTIVTEGGSTSGPVVAGNSYEHMLRAFVDHLVHGSPFPTQGGDAIANMAAIDAIYDASGLPRRGTPT